MQIGLQKRRLEEDKKMAERNNITKEQILPMITKMGVSSRQGKAYCKEQQLNVEAFCMKRLKVHQKSTNEHKEVVKTAENGHKRLLAPSPYTPTLKGSIVD